MATATIRFVDFMDGRPLPGGQADLRMEMVPGIRRIVGGDDGSRPSADLPDDLEERLLLDSGGLITKPREVVLPDFRRAESVEANAPTDGQGRIRVPLGDTVARVAEPGDGAAVEGVVAYLHASLEFFGFTPPRQRLNLGTVEPGASFSQDVPVDVGMAAVGHTTGTTTKLWFALHRPPDADHSFRLVVAQRPPEIAAPAREALRPLAPAGAAASTPDADSTVVPRLVVEDREVRFRDIDHTLIQEVEGLTPGVPYQYELRVTHGGGEFPILIGTFETPDPEQRDHVAFSFGSCHLPTVPPDVTTAREAGSRRLDRWQELVRRDDDVVLLLGDQIYGDGLEDKWRDQQWLDRYRLRYRQLWSYWPVRAVLRRTPTYMMLDDHDVRDDYGTVDFVGQDLGDMVDAARTTYRAFQHARNPGGPGREGDPGEPDDPLWYSFTRGPAAFFVMDSRSDRVPGQPGVLGEQQRQAIRDWATSAETRAHDVIVFATSIPPALLPTEKLRDIAAQFREDAEDALEVAGLGVGTLVGAGLGGLVAGPAGAAIGAGVLGAVGHEAGEEVVERGLGDIDRSLLLGKDLAERWDRAGTQQDLVEVLDLLFDLANGVGEDGHRRRAVFLLSGDIHTGTVHLIRSLPRGHGRRHSANPVLLQLTSSAISHEPVEREIYELAVSRIDDQFDIGLKDITLSDLWDASQHLDDQEELEDLAADKLDEVLGRDAASYTLDPDQGSRYRADFAGLLMDHTVGRVQAERVGPGRRYRFALSIESPDDALQQVIEMDLESRADKVPRFSLNDRETHLYLQVEQRRSDGTTAPLEGVEVEVVDQDAPAPAGDDVEPPKEETTTLGPGTQDGSTSGPAKVVTTRTTAYQPPTDDQVLTSGRTDRFGVVWLKLGPADRATTAGTVTTTTSTERFGTFPKAGPGGGGGGPLGGTGFPDRPTEGSTTQTHTTSRSLRELRPDLYFRLHLPDGRTVDTRDLDQGFFLNQLDDVGTSRDRAVFVVPPSPRDDASDQETDGGSSDGDASQQGDAPGAGSGSGHQPGAGGTGGGATGPGGADEPEPPPDIDLPPKVVIDRPDLDRRPAFGP